MFFYTIIENKRRNSVVGTHMEATIWILVHLEAIAIHVATALSLFASQKI
jgi:hypothetical protein